LLADVEANEAALRLRQDELERVFKQRDSGPYCVDDDKRTA
jgi:hypothetical protein